MITFDFETRSACDLIKHGAWVYSKHPTTQALCFSWRMAEGEPVNLWHRAHPAVGIEESPVPTELLEAVARGEPIEAHNYFFEFAIWLNALSREKPDWPVPRLHQWHCSMAKASAHALPRKLERATAALGLAQQKDMEGHRLMLKLSKPRRPLKAEREEMEARGVDPDGVLLWHEKPEELERLWEYNVQDVEAEEGLSLYLPPMSEKELRVFRMDQSMNFRGVYCDRVMAEGAIKIAREEVRSLDAMICKRSDGTVKSARSRAAFMDWIALEGVHLENTQAATVEDTLKRDDLPDTARLALEACRDSNKTSPRKYTAMLKSMDPDDDRVRDIMVYLGAGRTGRWSGKGMQVHNFPRGKLKDMDTACEAIRLGDRELLEALYGNVMETLSHATRGAICAPPGKDLLVADYSAIEARVLFWLAEEEEALDVFRRGEDIYLDMASEIYGYPCTKEDNPDERFMGKQSILGLGYQMGPDKFVTTCSFFGVNVLRPFAAKVVQTYRRKYGRVRNMWRDQEEAAIRAVQEPGTEVQCGRVSWRMEGRFLKCRLPSGRDLNYCDPELQPKLVHVFEAEDMNGDHKSVVVTVNPSSRASSVALAKVRKAVEASGGKLLSEYPQVYERPALTFMGVDSLSKKWVRQDTYGGKLVENITQATARDLLAEAMVRAEEDGTYSLLMSVHDELVCEADEGEGDVEEFEKMMSELPDWAEGCPVTAEGWRGKRYKK